MIAANHHAIMVASLPAILLSWWLCVVASSLCNLEYPA